MYLCVGQKESSEIAEEQIELEDRTELGFPEQAKRHDVSGKTYAHAEMFVVDMKHWPSVRVWGALDQRAGRDLPHRARHENGNSRKLTILETADPRAGFAARIEARFDGVVRVGELSRQRSLAVDVVLVACEWDRVSF